MKHDYDKKATVTVGPTGSTLLLAPVEHVDAGLYQCSLDVGAAQLRLVHSVEVYIAPELESRNWHPEINCAVGLTSYSSVIVAAVIYSVNGFNGLIKYDSRV